MPHVWHVGRPPRSRKHDDRNSVLHVQLRCYQLLYDVTVYRYCYKLSILRTEATVKKRMHVGLRTVRHSASNVR